ncbi:GNAT family N-acetyltransferase [Paracoccus contaminans]|nr:GNAT family N-acetyltransferase [Paracoccus contaminans]
MIAPAIAAAWQATWPAADHAQIGGFRVGRGMGGGGRVSAARAIGPWDAADIPAVEGQHAAWDQPPLFSVDDADSALAAALQAQGYQASDPTLILHCPVERLAGGAIPPVTAIEAWPPLAIQRVLWAEAGIGPARQAVMERAYAPKAAILGRIEDRAAGAAFAAVHGPVAMLHALAVLPRWRRKGLGAWMMRRAARFAARHDAAVLVLAVSEANGAARALYDAAGFERLARYHYWRKG